MISNIAFYTKPQPNLPSETNTSPDLLLFYLRAAGVARSEGPPEARRAAATGVAVAFGLAVIYGALLILVRNDIGRLFTQDAALVSLIASLMPMLAAFHLCNSIASSLGGILTGAGKQRSGAVGAIVAYFVVGVPVSYVCGYRLELGVVGLVIGRLAGKVRQFCYHHQHRR